MVDIVHHALIGLGGSLVLGTCGQYEGAAGFLLGSILPDLDAAFVLLGKDRYLRLHQGATHSILLAPLFAVGVALGMSLIVDTEAIPLAIGVAGGILLHVCLDALNTFGVRLLWPFRPRVALDAFFFVDLPLLAATIGALGSLGLTVETPEAALVTGAAWLTFLLAYATLRKAWTHRTKSRHGASHAVPDGINPLGVYLTWAKPAAIRTGYSRGWSGRISDLRTWEAPPAGTEDMCRSSPTYRNLEAALRLFVPVSTTVDGTRTTVVSRCLAVRNFGNRYGELRQRFASGVLEDEHARL